MAAPERPASATAFSSEEQALLGVLDADERLRYRDLRNSASYQRLPANVRDDLSRTLRRRPDLIGELADFTAPDGFQQLPDDQQREIYQLVVSGGLRAASTAANAGTTDRQSRLTPARLAVIFPGQRSEVGGGELSDTIRRARQMRTLFPNAQIDVVVFDPPQAINRRQSVVVDRPRRVTDYMHTQLGWNEPWDYHKQPVIEHDGLRFVYATAAASGPFRESYTFSGLDETTGASHREVRAGESLEHFSPVTMYPGQDSLGARAVNEADIALIGGTAQSKTMAWNLDSQGSPRGRVNINVYESDHQPQGQLTRTTALTTTLTDRDSGRVSDHSDADITAMRELAQTYADGQPSRAALLEQLGLSADTAQRLAGTEWATSYAHIQSDSDQANLYAWREALATRAAASGRPFTAFAVIPGGAKSEYMFDKYRNVFKALGVPATMPMPDLTRGPVTVPLGGGSTLVLTPAVRQRTFRSLLAGSTQVSFVTGTNSLADAIAAGNPFMYETLGGGQQDKMDAMRRAAPDILRRGGFTQPEIDAFVGALPERTRSKLDAVRALYSNPTRAAAMFRAMSDAVAVDDSAEIRTRIVAQLAQMHDPRARLIAEAMGRNDLESLTSSKEFMDWVATNRPEINATLLRTGVGAIGRSSLIGIVGSYLGGDVAHDLGLDGPAALATQLAVAMGIQTTAELAMAPQATPAVPAAITPRALLAGAVRSFPAGMFTGGVAGAALQAMGVDPGSFAYNSGVITAATAAQYGGSALQSYLTLAGYGRMSTGLAVAGRVSTAAGVAMAADWLSGLAWSASSDDATYQRTVGQLAARLSAGGAAPVVDVANMFLPTTVAALGQTANDTTWAQAQALVRASAEGAELSSYQRLAQTLQEGTGALGDATYENIRDVFFSDQGRRAQSIMQAAQGARRTGFASALLASPPRSESREDIAAWVNQTLPQLASQEFATAQRSLSRAAASARLQALPASALRTLASASDPAAELGRLDPDMATLVQRGDVRSSDIVQAANDALADPLAARAAIVPQVQQAVLRMNIFDRLAARPSQLPSYTLGPPDDAYARMLVDNLHRDPASVDTVGDELLRRGGVAQFFAAARPLGDAPVQGVARRIFASNVAPLGQFNIDTGVRSAQVLGGIAAAFGDDAPVTRAAAAELIRQITAAGCMSAASFIASASRSNDPRAIAGLALAVRQARWGEHKLWGTDLRRTLDAYLEVRGANWEDLPLAVREALAAA